MQAANFSLADVALVEVAQTNEVQQKPELLEGLKRALNEFIEKKITYSEACEAFKEIGSVAPVDRVKTILETRDTPIEVPSNSYGCYSGTRRKAQQWTSYEDQRLLAAMYKFGTENWARIATYVGNGRTRAQCSQRWFRGLDPKISRDRWTPEDDEKLLSLLDIYGHKAWTKIATEIGTRSDVQCRYHYRQMIKHKQIPPRNQYLEDQPTTTQTSHSNFDMVIFNELTFDVDTNSIFGIDAATTAYFDSMF